MRLLTVAEAAEYCRCSPFTIRRWIGIGMLRASRPGKAYLIRVEDIDALIAATAGGTQ